MQTVVYILAVLVPSLATLLLALRQVIAWQRRLLSQATGRFVRLDIKRGELTKRIAELEQRLDEERKLNGNLVKYRDYRRAGYGHEAAARAAVYGEAAHVPVSHLANSERNGRQSAATSGSPGGLDQLLSRLTPGQQTLVSSVLVYAAARVFQAAVQQLGEIVRQSREAQENDPSEWWKRGEPSDEE